MAEVDFSGIVGGKRKKAGESPGEGNPRNSNRGEEPVELPQKNMEQGTKNSGEKEGLEERIKKLEQELKEFHRQPKEEREKQGENFEFREITEQIKEKVRQSQGNGFNEQAIIRSVQAPKQAGEKTSGPKGKHQITRVPTGVMGLDELIQGGFEQGSSVLVVGSAGVGKTLLGLQFLYYGALDYREPGIFITFEEEKESLYKHSAAFGWDFDALEETGLFRVLEYKPHQVEKLMKEGGGPIRDAIKEMGAKRLVVDSITSYGMLFQNEYEKRQNILDLFDYLRKWGCTSLILSELPPKVAEVKEGSVCFLTDAIISLYYSKQHDTSERVHSMEILKMRGTKHTDKLLAIQFEKKGVTVYSDVEVF